MPIPEPFKKAYQILRWVTLAGLALVIVLILWKSPAPDVPNDPSAAARAEQKLEAADQARAAGLPAQVALDRTELNSYLAQSAVDVKAIRNKVGLSQSEFSERYGFPIRTLQDWELGRTQPPRAFRSWA